MKKEVKFKMSGNVWRQLQELSETIKQECILGFKKEIIADKDKQIAKLKSLIKLTEGRG